MKTNGGKRWVRTVVAGVILAALARGAGAQDLVASVATNDGSTISNVQVQNVDFDKALLSHSRGEAWFALNYFPDTGRKLLGLRTRQEEAYFERKLSDLIYDWSQVNANPQFMAWLVDSNPGDDVSRAALYQDALRMGRAERIAEMMNAWKAEQAAAANEYSYLDSWTARVRSDERTREARWLMDALRLLRDRNIEVSFLGRDGQLIRKLSWDLTAEEKALYARQYEAWKSLEGPNHKVEIMGPDGRVTVKDSSSLTPEERADYVKLHVTTHGIHRHDLVPTRVDVPGRHVKSTPAGTTSASSPATTGATPGNTQPPQVNLDSLKARARRGDKGARAQLMTMGVGW